MTTVPFRKKTSVAGLVSKMKSDPHAPLSAMIEIADRCNEICVHCYQVQGQKGEMTTEQLKRVLDDLAKMGVLFLTLSGGEPTLRHDFLEIVEYARSLKFAVKIYTNGLSMTQELAKKLGELAVQEVQISLYSHRAEVHDWVTRVPGSWDKTVNGARYLIAERVAVVIKSPQMTFNAAEYPEYIAFVTGLGADYALDTLLDPRENGDRDPEAFEIGDRALVDVFRDPVLIGERSGTPPDRALTKSVCGACSGHLHIEPNGDVRPCTQLDVPCGSAIEEGVAEAWSGNENARHIRSLTWADLHGCRDCDLRHYCSRCFAKARHETGDAVGPYESACRRAKLTFEAYRGRAPIVSGDGELDGRVGPYREESDGVYRAFADAMSDEDRERLARWGWIRSTRGIAPQPARAEPGDLVQIRRPGQKRPKAELVPSSQAVGGAAPSTVDVGEGL